ncbi:BTAD domain-containing putative transcriptional regulator [Micromonospora sp. WMMD1076]|uniref:AfsR/SARP family transcriptional regulator n=1 Tax=Micromonospora sp. WMMD1076 TaxID=3016103 RepID=UPI00249C2FFE|nr:BTAD domain-containing putative transcriptional regulator [Micromonospora sp. WMMD1076]WFF04576.1 BTAD domain-containing putative transcriptional regulator [Micromonospora sp. WMMD1076]
MEHVAVSPPDSDRALRPAAFRVLGPLTLTSGADALVLPPSKVTSLLAALLLHPDEVVSVGALQQAIWGDERPGSAKAALQTCALRLRQLFSRYGITGSVIKTVPGGYRITATAETVDLMLFRDLILRSRDEPDPEAELALLEEALALWSDPMLANVPSEALHRDTVPRISEERVRVIERVCDLKIGLGRDRSVQVDLWTATRAYPANERFSTQLASVLYRTGRQADALAELRRIREHLASELGVAPGPVLRGLELTILRGEAPTPAGPVSPPAATPTRHPLTPGFVGRDALGGTIAERLRAGCPIVALSGPPGVGKTALARHVAQLVADDFPGGQVRVEVSSGEASPLEHVEQQLHAAFGRDVGARRLLVLDGVVDARQARELPALVAPGDALLLTSRQSLSGPVARLGGWLHRVEPLDPADSLRMLAATLGPEQVDADPQAATALAALCDHLPLALRIAATRILLRARMSLAQAVQWLGADPLGRLSLPGEPDMSIGFRFDETLSRTGEALTAAFVRLATAAPAPITVERAAQLLDVQASAARDLLDALVDHSLVEEAVDHYWIRGLLRRHAHAVADRSDPPPHPYRAKGSL